jgi:hypothetical protein
VIMKPLQSLYSLAFVAAVCGTSAVGQPSPKPLDKNYILNSGFEQAESTLNTLPSEWKIDVANKTDTIEIVRLDSSVRHCGVAAVRINFTEAMNYSGVIQSIPVSGLAGKMAHFSGFIRRSSVKSIIGIWLSVADNKGKQLAYINSYKQPLNPGRDWSRHSLSIRIPKEASVIRVGAAIYEKDGTMWADDLRLSNRSVEPVSIKSCNTEDNK